MKHTWNVTILLAVFFFATQVVGLLVINQYIDHKKTAEAHEVVPVDLAYGLERPQIENKDYSWVMVSVAILVGTLIVLLLIKLKTPFLMRIMYMFAIFFTLALAFAAFVNEILAAILALCITIWRVYKPNLIVQNISELFIYGGLAAFFVGFFNVFSAIVLLIVISIYDYISVFKTKHMVEMAKFQLDSKVFAGFHIPYSKEKILMKEPMRFLSKKENKSSKPVAPLAKETSVAVLGGGDIGFTLLFAGTVMQRLVLVEPTLSAFLKTLIIPFLTTIALLILLFKGQKNKFYPAMPVVTLGCFGGLIVVMFISPEFAKDLLNSAYMMYSGIIGWFE